MTDTFDPSLSSLDNLNTLSPVNFQFFLKRAPHLNYFLQEAEIPALELGFEEQATPFQTIPHPGEHMAFDPFNCAFKVDEDLGNYQEVANWMRTLGRVKNSDGYAQLQNATMVDQGVKSDLTMLVYDGKQNVNFEVVFVDAFPVALSKIRFAATDTSISFSLCSARFLYTYFDINKIS